MFGEFRESSGSVRNGQYVKRTLLKTSVIFVLAARVRGLLWDTMMTQIGN